MAAVVPLICWSTVCGRGGARDHAIDPLGEAFDSRHGVDTTGIISLSALSIADPNWVYGLDYQPVEVFDFASLFAELAVDLPKTVFLDLGAGKGRAVLLASQLPFKQVVGVEISPELASIARSNVEKFARFKISDLQTEIVCSDVADIQVPLEPLVVYVYNPFTVPIMEQVIDNLINSVTQQPRRILVIYFRPELAEMWDYVAPFSLLRSTPRYRVYESQFAKG
ncbi:MAG: SAM-dependent methyltransferase [Gammaproteobacteria bacterium]|jgi:SAM-dependent methyltransferase